MLVEYIGNIRTGREKITSTRIEGREVEEVSEDDKVLFNTSM
jgi:ASC-1-like (ASCH) protein